jgi:hypothetical protein
MICCNCKRDLPESSFGWKSIAKNIHHSRCYSCTRDYKNQWYKDNRQHHMNTVKITKKARIDKNKEMIREYLLSHPCACGISDIRVLDFHHIDPSTKEATISKLMQCRASDRVLEEMLKCEVVCRNCHAIIHNIWR